MVLEPFLAPDEARHIQRQSLKRLPARQKLNSCISEINDAALAGRRRSAPRDGEQDRVGAKC